MTKRTTIVLSENQLSAVAAILLVVFVVGKMVGLESLALGSPPFEFKFVAALLPFAMVFRRYGIAGIGIGCPLAHLIAFGSIANAGFAFCAAFGGSLGSYGIYRRYNSPHGLLIGTLVILAFWTFIFGGYFAYVSNIPILTGFWETFSSLWIGVSIVGFGIALLIRKAMKH
jgi:uncharacterized membrane protein